MIKKAFGVFALCCLSGCQQPPAWSKPGASTAEFATEKYQCMQRSQHQVSTAYVGRYGGFASSEQTLNSPLYAACMNARGWYQENTREVEAVSKDLTAKVGRVCADPKFSAIYSNTPCNAGKMIDTQLADTSKISSSAKASFSEWRNAVDAYSEEGMSLLRRYGSGPGADAAKLFSATKGQTDQNNANLYNGLITWGEYNAKRQAIYLEFETARKRIA